MGSADFININNLSIGYASGSKQKIVAANLNAQINKGELVCLLGSNGAGKSTLMRTLCGFQPFFDGQISILGKTIGILTEREISRLVSVVLTDRIVVPNATVSELVSYGRSPYTGILGRTNKKDLQFIERAIEQCGIAHKKDALLSSISDGERQKAFIAKALAQDTPVILLDEPTAFLDLPARVEIIQLLRRISSESGKSVLLSTHDLDLALQMADRLWLLHNNGPLITGSPEDLLLQNAFQRLFQNKGIEFDTKTGLFRVEYEHFHELPIKGHGFEYVLLRRAFARRGIKTTGMRENPEWWIEIGKNGQSTFHLYKNEKQLISESSVEMIVKQTMNCMDLKINNK
ncbi:ABC transporter ATP-binding protein [Maribellus maritimus]|uniref:ABC transporter ATP-binding protein n=1 Tax=Maribellus maritimus TaxID=2870838 RepID=UPI001EE9DE2A|nr:ABC transporter ATP-binding protein [Maribellus maritimus]MCG6190297.1 ABC transporter ATP-binding protein [Maribellus maritimus]